LFRAFLYDYIRYRKYSYYYPRESNDLPNLNAMIFREAHGLEKGLSLPEVRLGYGTERINKIISLMIKYDAQGGRTDDLAIQKARSVLGAYIRFHDEKKYDIGERREELLRWADMQCGIGGYFKTTRGELEEMASGDFAECALSRCSVRDYSAEKVPRGLICEAVDIARKTPSVCNRQPWHLYIVDDDVVKGELVKLQDGGGGFGDKAAFLAIVTTDLKSFIGWGERNEAFVDGGLFAMSLLYAFHYKKLGACPLNWMVTPEKDRRVRELIRIKPSENIIMIISAGKISEKVRIAKSVRKSVSDQLTFL